MIASTPTFLVRAVMPTTRSKRRTPPRFLRARDETNPAFINPVVAAEFVWVLRAVYRMPRHVIVDILRAMIESALTRSVSARRCCALFTITKAASATSPIA